MCLPSCTGFPSSGGVFGPHGSRGSGCYDCTVILEHLVPCLNAAVRCRAPSNSDPRRCVRAGPRAMLHFDPSTVKAAIVTCGARPDAAPRRRSANDLAQSRAVARGVGNTSPARAPAAAPLLSPRLTLAALALAHTRPPSRTACRSPGALRDSRGRHRHLTAPQPL